MHNREWGNEPNSVRIIPFPSIPIHSILFPSIPFYSHPFPSIRWSFLHLSTLESTETQLSPGIVLQDFFCNQTAARQLDPNEMARRYGGAASGTSGLTKLDNLWSRWICGPPIFLLVPSNVFTQHEITHVQFRNFTWNTYFDGSFSSFPSQSNYIHYINDCDGNEP